MRTLRELGTERERDFDSKQSPDFNNVGLLIWAWAALHLSQQEQAAKTHTERTYTQDAATKIHNLILTHTHEIGGKETGALSAVPLYHTSAQK